MSCLVREGQAGKVIVARIKKDTELISEIEKLCLKNKIKSGYIPTIIGGIEEADLISMKSAEPKLENEVIKHKGPFEVLGSGTVSLKDGKPFVHAHMTLAKHGNDAISGHLVKGKIALFIEVVIVELNGVNMVRKEDPDVYNLALLNFED